MWGTKLSVARSHNNIKISGMFFSSKSEIISHTQCTGCSRLVEQLVYVELVEGKPILSQH